MSEILNEMIVGIWNHEKGTVNCFLRSLMKPKHSVFEFKIAFVTLNVHPYFNNFSNHNYFEKCFSILLWQTTMKKLKFICA